MITLYHGSNQHFHQFEIHEKHVRRSVHTLVEGVGIYFSEDKAFAASYGDYVYEVALAPQDITDFTDEKTIRHLLITLSEKLAIPLMAWLNVPQFIENVQNGNLSVTTLDEEISGLLENNEAFYLQYEALVTDEEAGLAVQIKRHFLNSVQDVLKYYDRSFKQAIYICIKNPKNLNVNIPHLR